MKAICHDQRNIISGRIESMTETGCILVSDSTHSDPVFPQKAQVTLNIASDKRSGESCTLRARLTAVTREDGRWLYRIRWNSGDVKLFA